MARRIHPAMAVAALACWPAASGAAVTDDELALSRCQAVYDIAFETFHAMAGRDNLDDQARDELGLLASEAQDASLQTTRTILAWTHMTQSDDERLGEAEDGESAEILTSMNGVASLEEADAALDQLIARYEACLAKFPLE